jgi:nicotinate-nucleotide pyrophosphorylase (carboxylating)
LEEDQWHWDWTTRGSLADAGARNRIRTARIVAKSSGVWAADGLDRAIVDLAALEGFKLECRNALANGAPFMPGDILTRWQGPAHALLIFERVFLNLASWTSGIATRTRRSVDLLDQAWKALGSPPGVIKPRLTATRKTLPGFRDLSVQAVMAGGGSSHRTSLAGGVLIKENHVAAAGGISAAVAGVRAVSPHGLLVEIEVRNHPELEEALAQKVECIMLDNFRPEEVRSALQFIERSGIPRKPVIEVSGGITDESIASYVVPGVDIISSGGLTHSVNSSDFSMLIDWS